MAAVQLIGFALMISLLAGLILLGWHSMAVSVN
jgi:hypothetical protein